MFRLSVAILLLMGLGGSARAEKAVPTDLSEKVVLVAATLPKIQLSERITHILYLHILLFKDSGWTRLQVEVFLQEAQKVYETCGIQLQPVDVFDTIVPASKLPLNKFLSTANEHWYLAKLVKELPIELQIPTVFFVKDFSDAEPTAFSRANFIVGDGKTDPLIYDTIWMPLDVVNQALEKPYSILAHELTHVLTLDGQHNSGDPVGDILSIWKKRNNDISKYCEIIKQNPHVKPL